MSGDNRLERLKDLVGRLEQLPASDERDRVLGEVRARAVDLDTGVTPRAMLPVDSLRLRHRPDRHSAHTVPIQAPVRVPLTAAQKDCPPRPRTWSRAPLHAAAPAGDSIDLLAVDERLSLEEPLASDCQPSGQPAHRAWERGLRG
jgi:hypothetical protein